MTKGDLYSVWVRQSIIELRLENFKLIVNIKISLSEDKKYCFYRALKPEQQIHFLQMNYETHSYIFVLFWYNKKLSIF